MKIKIKRIDKSLPLTEYKTKAAAVLDPQGIKKTRRAWQIRMSILCRLEYFLSFQK